MQCLATTIPNAEEWISAFTSYTRSDLLYPVFRFFTIFGEEYFFLTAIVILLHFMRRKTAMQLALVVMVTALFNSSLKMFFQECRPLSVSHLVSASGFSFPSGHAQVGGAFWGFLMFRSAHKWQSYFLLAFIFMIALSRPYLGVHYFHDVAVGLALGLSISWIFHRWGDRFIDSIRTSYGFLVGGFLLCLLFPSEESFKIFGALAGFIFGYEQVKKTFSSDTLNIPSKGLERNLSLLFSAIGVAVFWWGLKILLTKMSLDNPLLGLLRYFLLGFWITAISPSLAKKFSLYQP